MKPAEEKRFSESIAWRIDQEIASFIHKAEETLDGTRAGLLLLSHEP
jgi:hypothetical protein